MTLVELTDGHGGTLSSAPAQDAEAIWITASEVNLNRLWGDDPGPRPQLGVLERAGGPLRDYWLIEPLGHGSHGQVWKAVRVAPSLKVVALKVLRQDRPHHADRRARFHREAEIAMRLRGPAILPVEEIGEVDGALYMVMPLVDGATLADVIAHRRQGQAAPGTTASRSLPGGSWWMDQSHEDYTTAIVRCLSRIARALALTHAHRLVHRDIKPANILLDRTSEERVFLADFGLGRHLDETTLPLGDASGTPVYMAPEKLLGREVDEVRCDIYGLGVTLFEAVTLIHPIPVPAGLLRSCLPSDLADIEPLRPGAIRPGFPPALETIILKAMHRDPSLRYASAAAVANDLEGWLKGIGAAAVDWADKRRLAETCRLRGDAAQPWANPHARQDALAPSSAHPLP